MPGRERISDVDLRYQLEMPAIESEVPALIRVAQPSVAALLSVGRKAPADSARVLLVDLESLRTVCPLFSDLGDQCIHWERRRALLVTLVGDRAMRPSLSCETSWVTLHPVPLTSRVPLLRSYLQTLAESSTGLGQSVAKSECDTTLALDGRRE